MKKLVIFDLDGTLIDTLEDLAEAVNFALEKRGLPLHGLEEYRQMVGHGVRNLVKQALEASMAEAPGDEYIDAALADFKEYYSAHIDVHTRPYQGIPELLAALIKEFFPEIPFVAILGNSPELPLKPSPEIVERALANAAAALTDQATTLSKADAIMVGDSPTDMRTAANGGIDAIAVSWGYRTADELAGNRLVSSVAQLRDILVPFYVSEPMSTPPQHFESPLQELVYKTFDAKGIPFTRVDTDPGITMEDCQHIDAKIGVRIVKTVFLCNRQQTEFYLYVTSDDKPFVTRDFCGALGIPRVSFASAEKLWELTGVKVGATTILSAILPSAKEIHLVMDADIAQAEWFACTDGTATCFVKIRTSDLRDKYLCGKNLQLL